MASTNQNKWKKYLFGFFTDEQDAIEARKEAELKYFGEFAYKETN